MQRAGRKGRPVVAGERGKGVPPLPALVVGLWALLYTTLAWVAMISLMFWDFVGRVGGGRRSRLRNLRRSLLSSVNETERRKHRQRPR